MTRVSVGIGLRDAHIDELLQLRDRTAVDVLEVMIDEALHPGKKRDRWRRLGSRWPLIAHGTELGIADAAGPAAHYVEHIHETARALHIHWYSEHLSFLNAGDVALGHFAPMFDDDESLAALARSSRKVCDGLPCPLLLENPADILGYGSHGDDAAQRQSHAFGRALAAAQCGALLDLTNLVYNARNDGFRVADYLASLDWPRVVEVHLAGGRMVDGLWIDSHDQAVDPEALEWLGEVARNATQLRAVIIERDNRLPSLAAMLAEVEQVRTILQSAGRT